MTGIVIGLLVVTTLSLVLRNTLWVGFIGIFLLCNLYPVQAVTTMVIAAVAYLVAKFWWFRSG